MVELSRNAVEAALGSYVEPHMNRDLMSAGCVEAIRIEGDRLGVDLELGFPARRVAGQLREAVRAALADVPGVEAIEINLSFTRPVRQPDPQDVSAIPGVRDIIAVSSGKGGVGKSTTAVNLALALSDEGARVGLLDADIYGPSLPRMLGVSGRPTSRDGKQFQPMTGYGLQVMSAGFLIDEEEPMVWRGAMATQALEQLLRETEWHDLDYLIVDMPPGTGDIQLTLAQRVKVAGAVIVTTPQDIALLDANRGYRMFEKVGVPVLGIIENMGLHHCSNCGHEEHVFGDGGGMRMAEKYGLDLLGSLPLDIRIREHADSGKPTVVAEPDGPLADGYRKIARSIAARLWLRTDGPGQPSFPTISMSDT